VLPGLRQSAPAVRVRGAGVVGRLIVDAAFVLLADLIAGAVGIVVATNDAFFSLADLAGAAAGIIEEPRPVGCAGRAAPLRVTAPDTATAGMSTSRTPFVANLTVCRGPPVQGMAGAFSPSHTAPSVASWVKYVPGMRPST
jgi:hypothetical protein